MTKRSYLTKCICFILLLLVTGCVTVEPEKPIIVNGATGYLKPILLPTNSFITIAIIDLDTPGIILDQKTFNISRLPIPFKFLIPKNIINPKANYGVVALVKTDGIVVLQTYGHYPVINNNSFQAKVVMEVNKDAK